jgi:AraC family transcriptional regulator
MTTHDFEIINMPNKNFIGIHIIGEEYVNNAFNQIEAWAMQHQLLTDEQHVVCRIFWDSYATTTASKIKMSIGILSEKQLPTNDRFTTIVIPHQKYMVAKKEIQPADFGLNWRSLYKCMAENNLVKADVPPMEMYYNNWREHPQKKCVVDLLIPIL